jgi:hypothetical protein
VTLGAKQRDRRPAQDTGSAGHQNMHSSLLAVRNRP